MSDMRSWPFLWTYLVFLIQSGILPYSCKLSAHGIRGQLHTWLTDFLYSRSQHVPLNGILSSPLPVKAGVPQSSVPGPVLFLIFINDLFDSLQYPLYLFADDSTLCYDIPHPSYRQGSAFSLSKDLNKIPR